MLAANHHPPYSSNKFIGIFNLIIPYHTAKTLRMSMVKSEDRDTKRENKTI